MACVLFWYLVEQPRLNQCEFLGRLPKENGSQNDACLNQDNHELRAINLAFRANDLA